MSFKSLLVYSSPPTKPALAESLSFSSSVFVEEFEWYDLQDCHSLDFADSVLIVQLNVFLANWQRESEAGSDSGSIPLARYMQCYIPSSGG